MRLLILLVACIFSFGQTQRVALPPVNLYAESHGHDHDDDNDHHGDHDHDDDHHNDDHDHHDDDHDHDDHEHHDDDHDHDHGGVEGTRLLVTDADSANSYIIDLATGDVIATFTTPGEAGRAYASPSGQFGFILHRNENRVSLVHSGLTAVDHGDHMDLLLGSPYIAATMNVGRQPTHFFNYGNDIAIYNDQDGTIAVLDQRLLGVTLDYTEIVASAPDHGAPIVWEDFVLSGQLAPGHVEIYRRDGTLVDTVEGCPRLHGQTRTQTVMAFGCSDGVLLFTETDGEFTATKIDNPSPAPENARVGTLTSHDDSPVLIGNFGSGIAIIDPEAATITAVELPANPIVMTFVDGDSLLVLLTDGSLHDLEPTTGEVRRSLQATAAFDADFGVRAVMSLQGEHVYITDPAAGQVHEVHLDDFEVERTMDLGFTPFSIATLAIPGAVIH